MGISKELTIVIPCYNEAKHIYRTLSEIDKQTTGIRIIITDANSTDNTLEEISKASNKFTNLNIEVTQGGPVGYGRNKGAELVETPYILFMDADSILLDSDILYRLEQYRKKYDIIGVKQKSTGHNIKSIITWLLFNWVRDIMPQTFCTGCFFFISKQKFDELGGFDEEVQNSEDFVLSNKVPKDRFLILDRYIGQDDRRFEKIGYFKFFKILFRNYQNTGNLSYFKKDVGYWDEYKL